MGGKFKYVVLGVAVLFIGMVIYGKMFPADGGQEITGIQAEFVGEAESGGKYTRAMFDVKGITSSGRMIKVKDFSVKDPTAVPDEETGELPPLTVAEHGSSCEVVVEVEGATGTLSDTVTVNITREAGSQKDIGYPNEKDATVTYYTNGDLEFTGNGNVMNFGSEMPWSECEYSHVYFDDTIGPENMDNWFQENELLEYCDPIPKTVKTMKYTFAGCVALKNAPEYFQCLNLQIMDYAFSGCEALETVDVIPVSVSSAQYTFERCTSLQNPASLDKTSNLTNITGMYSGCTSLIAAVAIPETVTTMDQVYMDCINIKEAVKFPGNVQSIADAYSGCAGITVGAAIPESVSDMRNCFYGCASLAGDLEINTDTDEFGGLLQGAAINGDRLSLFGNSGNLLAIQKDSGNESITLADPAAAALQNERMIRERELQEGVVS